MNMGSLQPTTTLRLYIDNSYRRPRLRQGGLPTCIISFHQGYTCKRHRRFMYFAREKPRESSVKFLMSRRRLIRATCKYERGKYFYSIRCRDLAVTGRIYDNATGGSCGSKKFIRFTFKQNSCIEAQGIVFRMHNIRSFIPVTGLQRCPKLWCMRVTAKQQPEIVHSIVWVEIQNPFPSVFCLIYVWVYVLLSKAGFLQPVQWASD